MAMWLGAGRQYDMNKRPTITDLGKYIEEWMSWWTGMQPSGRMGKDSRLVRNETVLTDGWDGLQKPGPNGFFAVMLTLYWWGLEGAEMDSWQVAMEDVGWCLLCMVSDSGPR